MTENEIEVQQAPRRFRKLSKADFLRMGLPREFWHARLSEIHESGRRLVERYIEKLDDAVASGDGIIFFGGTGVGKTSAAAVLAKALRASRRSVYFTNFWNLRDDVKKGALFDDDQGILERCKFVDALIIDGVQKSDADERWTMTISDLCRLVRYRRSERKLSILTVQTPFASIKSDTDGSAVLRPLTKELYGCCAFCSIEGDLRRADVTKKYIE